SSWAEAAGAGGLLAACHRPAHQHRLLQPKMIHQLLVIARASLGQMAIRRFVALPLRTRIDGDHVVPLREFIDLLLPDPSRHRPPRNEDDRTPATRLNIMN